MIGIILIIIFSIHFDETLVSGGATMWFPQGGHLQWINGDRDDDDHDNDDDDVDDDDDDDDNGDDDGAVSVYKPLYPQ